MEPQYTTEQLNEFRRRVLAGETIEIEQYTAIIRQMQAKRSGDMVVAHEKAASPKATKAKKPAGPPVELPDFLKDL